MDAITKYLGLESSYTTYLIELGTLPTFRMPGSHAVCARKSSTAALAALEQSSAIGSTSTSVAGV
jgi:hypothetical protein